MNNITNWLYKSLRKAYTGKILEEMGYKKKPLVVDFPYCQHYEPGDLVEFCHIYWFDEVEQPDKILIKSANETTAHGMFLAKSAKPTDLDRAIVLFGDIEQEVFMFQIRPANQAGSTR